MGVFERLKNALFEEEYVEVEVKPKKVKPQVTEPEEKPIAKKVVLTSKRNTGRREEPISVDEPMRPEEPEIDVIQNNEPNPFNDMDDDFNMDDVDSRYVVDEEEERRKEEERRRQEEEKARIIAEEKARLEREQQIMRRKREPYGIDEHNKNLVPDYGKGYDPLEEKTTFRPSPIISPIYGVLDKNYKKEDVVDKNAVKTSKVYGRSRERVNVDDIRNKAYGTLSDDIQNEIEKNNYTKLGNTIEEESKFVDLTEKTDRPSLNQITVGEALEYFQDLGLEYNVDYVDANKVQKVGRRSEKQEEPELFELREEALPMNRGIVNNQPVNDEPVIHKSTPLDIDVEADDNLFDLIDSMYQDN